MHGSRPVLRRGKGDYRVICFSFVTFDLPLFSEATMDIKDRINSYLSPRSGEPPLVSSAELQWSRRLDASRSYGTLLLEISRPVTTDGGDGWNGFDAADEDRLHHAVQMAVLEAGAGGIIKRYIVRGKSPASAR